MSAISGLAKRSEESRIQPPNKSKRFLKVASTPFIAKCPLQRQLVRSVQVSIQESPAIS